LTDDGLVPLYGVDTCCRTSLVYCPQNLSCYWELGAAIQRGQMAESPRTLIEQRLKLGGNIVTYATNRQLKGKLDRPQIAGRGSSVSASRGTLVVPKLQHAGGADDAPNALANLLRHMQQQFQMRVDPDRRLVSPSQGLAEFPILFLHGRRSFRFTPAQRNALATYLQRGGFIFADAICGNQEFAQSFRQEMQAIFPDQPLTPIPTDHDLFSDKLGGYSIRSVTVRDPKLRQPGQPLEARLRSSQPRLEGIQINQRMAVVFSPWDISCALENQPSLECRGYVKEDALRLGANIILFGLLQ